MNIIIIEDEPKTAKNIEQVLLELNNSIKIVGVCDSIEQSVEKLNSVHPDLIFMDIQLADGLSFEIFNRVKVECPVVFLTAFDEYAIKAFKVNSIDYILKPFNKNSIEKALNKYKTIENYFNKWENFNNNISQLIEENKSQKLSAILVSSGEKYIPIDVSDIALFFIQSGNTYLYTLDEKKYYYQQSLEDLELNLSSKQFFRVNRQVLINFSSIKEIEHYFNRKLLLHLKVQFPEKITVSKEKAQTFLNWMSFH